MICQQGTRQPKFIQLSKENGQKLIKGNFFSSWSISKKKKIVTLLQVHVELYKVIRFSKIIVCFLKLISMICLHRKANPTKNLSRWKLVLVLMPVMWIDLLEAIMYRAVDLFMELAGPLLLRLLKLTVFNNSMIQCWKTERYLKLFVLYPWTKLYRN